MDAASSFHIRAVGSDEGRGLARALGWLSVGLGLSELLAPRSVARLIGLGPHGRAPSVLRAFGLRELAVGVSALSRPRRAGALWARVIGDALDITALGLAARGRKASKGRAAAALVGLAGITAFDIMAARRLSAVATPALPIVYAVTINRTPTEVYTFFRELDNLPQFMNFLESVTVLDDTRSRWVARLPVGGRVSWDAVITSDVPGQKLAWRSAAGRFEHSGTVTFERAPGRDATEVRVTMALGVAGSGARPSATLAKLLTRAQVKGDLRRLKQVIETGEVLFSDASAHVGKHPAQPSAEGTKLANERASRSRAAAQKGGLL